MFNIFSQIKTILKFSVEHTENLNPTTPPLKERMRLSSSSGVIQNIKKLVAGSSFQSRLNADEAMDVDVKPGKYSTSL